MEAYILFEKIIGIGYYLLLLDKINSSNKRSIDKMVALNMLLLVFSPYTAILTVFFTAFRLLQKDYIVFKNSWNSGLLIIFIWSLFSGIINMNPISSAASVAVLLYLLVSIYLQNYYMEEWKIEKLLRSVVLFSLFSVFIGIVEKFASLYSESIWWGHIFGIPSQIMTRDGYRIYGTFGNPNIAGAWFVVIILICLYFYDESLNFSKFVYAGASLLFVVMLLLTASRGAALGLEVGLAAYAFFRRDRKNMYLLLLIFLLVMVLMFIVPELSVKHYELDSSINHNVSNSVNSRQTIWRDCFNMFKSKPLTGWGLMGVYFASSDVFHYYSREPHAHNILITFAATLGIIGLGVYIYMKYHLFENIIFLHNRRCRLTPLLAGIQAAIMGHGLVDFTIMVPQICILYIGCSAIISALALQYSGSTINGLAMPMLNKKRTA